MKQFITKNLAMEFYRECQKLFITNSVIKNQFERATLSIVLNLAEGSGKITSRDKRKFYSIALGSLRESQTILELINNTEQLKKTDKLAAHIYKLMQNPNGV